LTAPGSVAATDGTATDKVTVSWDASTGAATYDVYRNTANDSGTATRIGSDVAVTSYDDTTAVPGTQYYYFVKAKTSVATSAFSVSNDGYRQLTAPEDMAASNGTYADKVHLFWTASTGATTYEIWRSETDASGAAAKLGESGGALTYNDTTAVAGTHYFYFLKAKTATALSDFGVSDEGWRSA
jgi:hypothetical protein